MIYFFLNLAMHIAISFMLVMLLIHRLQVNSKRINRWGITYLLPGALAFVTLVQMILFTIPRMLDTSNMIRGIYDVQIGHVEKVDFLNNAITLDGERYFYNPMAHKPQVGDLLEIKSTSYSGYIHMMKKMDAD